MATVRFDNVTKEFFTGKPVVSNFNLTVKNGELLTLVGPSGCGKTTLLRMIAGLEDIGNGEIYIGNKNVNQVPPQDRHVAMVFQNYALYPHMSVRKNLEFPLRMQKISRQEMDKRIHRTVKMLDLANVMNRKPEALSGGQRQRVAMGRAIVRDADVFLMDEPLSNLDANLRMQIRTEISQLQAKLGITTIYVTHDQVEAMTLGHRVAVIHSGTLQQVATPHDLYLHPANIFVARFIGSPGMNIFSSPLELSDNNQLRIYFGKTRLPIDVDPIVSSAIDKYIGKEVFVGIRPESISLDSHESSPVNVRIESSETLGHETILYFRTDSETAINQSHKEKVTDPMAVILPGHHHYQNGISLKLYLNTKQFTLFTPEGEALFIK